MTGIKLSQLPKRTPVRVTISMSPELGDALQRYAGFYRSIYGQEETVAELVPAILTAFLNSDKAFNRWCRDASDTTG